VVRGAHGRSDEPQHRHRSHHRRDHSLPAEDALEPHLPIGPRLSSAIVDQNGLFTFHNQGYSLAPKSNTSVLVRTIRCPGPSILPSVRKKTAPSVESPLGSLVWTSARALAVAAALAFDPIIARAPCRRIS